MSESRTKNSVKNATINVAAKILTMICAFVIRTIFLKYLGDQYTGVSTLFTDLLNILSFTELGIGTAVSFSLYKPIAENNDYRIAQLMKLYKYIYLAISCVVLILGILLIPFLDLFVTDVPDIKESITIIYIMYVIKTSLSYLLVYRSTLVIAKQKQFIVTGIESTCTAIKTVFDVILLITTRNFMVYLWLEIARVIATNLIISMYSKRDIPNVNVDVRIEKKDLLSLFKDVKDVFLYKVSGIVLSSTGSVITSMFVNVASVTLLSNYNMIVSALNNMIYQVTSAMTASVGNLAAVKTKDEQREVFYTVNFLSFVFSLVECTGLWMCANSFVELLWGEQYVLSSSVVALLCINAFVVNMHLSVDMFRTANGMFRKGRLRPLATAIINLTVSLIAVQYLGLFGVWLGVVVARLATQTWYDPKIVFNNIFNCSVKKYYLKYVCYLFVTVGICIIGTFLLNCLPESAIIRFVFGFLYAVIISVGIIILLFRKTKEYRNTIVYVRAILKK